MARGIVYVVDDDTQVRTSLERLFHSVDLECATFSTADEFLRSERTDEAAALVLDLRLPGVSGLELQRQLADAEVRIPIVFVTGHGDIPLSVRAMKSGAVDFLVKPFQEQDLLDAVNQALEQDRTVRRERAELEILQKRYESLTSRERDVFSLVITGLLNKQIAAELGSSERTIKSHRHQVMEKMEADSVADLVRMAHKLGLPDRSPSLCVK